MQLDKTRIAIRERSFPDILDLSLLAVRRHAVALLLMSMLGAAPCMALNAWLLSDTLGDVDFSFDFPGEYLFSQLWLIVWEIPLAAAPATLYLGQVMFMEKPSASRMIKDWFASLPQLILFQVIVRGILSFFVLPWVLLFGVWPYLNEILLLERNGWRKKGPQGVSTLSRTTNMHKNNGGELFVRWMGSVLLGAGLIAVVWGSCWYLRGLLASQWEFGRTMYTIYLPAVTWLVIGYFSVVRYLSYLDLRIRTEGWEIELAMRAEAAKLARQVA